MPSYFISLLTWTANNDMQINASKTKEMILGSLNSIILPMPPLFISSDIVERIVTFKATLTQICPDLS